MMPKQKPQITVKGRGGKGGMVASISLAIKGRSKASSKRPQCVSHLERSKAVHTPAQSM